MLIQRIKLAVATLAACVGVVLVGGVVLRAQPGAPLPAAPNGIANAPRGPPENRLGAAGPQNKGNASPQDQIDEPKKEIESLRKRVEALEQIQRPPAPERQKIVAICPLTKDIVIARRYVGKVVAHHHINVCALATGVVAEIPVKEGQAVKKGDVLFEVVPTLSRAKPDAEMAEVRIAKLEMDNAKKLFEQKVLFQREVSLSEAKLAKAEARAKLAEAEFKSHLGRLNTRTVEDKAAATI